MKYSNGDRRIGGARQQVEARTVEGGLGGGAVIRHRDHDLQGGWLMRARTWIGMTLFAAAMIAMYVHKMRRAAALLAELGHGSCGVRRERELHHRLRRPTERRHDLRHVGQQPLRLERDHLTHPYFAGHGYAAVRVDLRGTGDSASD